MTNKNETYVKNLSLSAVINQTYTEILTGTAIDLLTVLRNKFNDKRLLFLNLKKITTNIICRRQLNPFYHRNRKY
ncbi:MAG: hypothetical protein ACI9WT_001817 [Flavobacterium sp.]|jgi:hypothetical protein